MRKAFLCSSIFVCILFALTTQAFAQSKKYIIAPFQVNGSSDYAYLSEALPSMLSSRVYKDGIFESVEIADKKVIKTANEAQALLDNTNADYIIYGSITMLGTAASIDMTGLNKDGKKWQKSENASIDELISKVQPMAEAISVDFFSAPSTSTVATKNPTLSETGRSEIISGSSIKEVNIVRDKSQPLDYSVISMDIGNFTGNGNSDIVLADDLRNIYLYTWNGGAMIPRGKFRVGSSERVLAVRTFEQNKQNYIAVTCFNDTQLRAYTVVLMYDGKTLVEYMTMPFFTNTTVIPETGRKILIGQYSGTNEIYRGPIFEVFINGKKWEKGMALTGLPKRANVYNFTYFASGIGANNNVAMIDKSENLHVHDSRGDNLTSLDDLFSGGLAYIATDDGAPTLSTDSAGYQYYFIPLRVVSTDLNKDGNRELLVNHPITTIGEYLKNFRSFSESEIHAYTWDGIGLALTWQTPIVNATIADFQVADVNNDNQPELLSAVVTSTGLLGMGKGRTVITLTELPTK